MGAEYFFQLLTEIMGCLIRGRTGLVTPKKKTIDELMNSPNMVNTNPEIGEIGSVAQISNALVEYR